MNNDYVLIKENNFQKVRNLIQKNKGKKIIFFSPNDDLNRKILEKENIDILLLNQLGRKDWTKQRNSGLNQVLAKIAKKRNISIGINLDEIIDTNDLKIKSDIIARIKQNIKLCNKNKLKMNFISLKENKRNSYDLKALGLSLGMPTWMTKNI